MVHDNNMDAATISKARKNILLSISRNMRKMLFLQSVQENLLPACD